MGLLAPLWGGAEGDWLARAKSLYIYYEAENEEQGKPTNCSQEHLLLPSPREGAGQLFFHQVGREAAKHPRPPRPQPPSPPHPRHSRKRLRVDTPTPIPRATIRIRSLNYRFWRDICIEFQVPILHSVIFFSNVFAVRNPLKIE